MPAPTTRWEIFPRAPETHLAQFPGIPRLVIQLLYNRGIYRPAEVHAFLEGEETHDPYLLKDVPEAVAHLLSAIQNNAPIVVYGDYDADGVTATVLMVQALQGLGANVRPYIPDRFDEGYGLNKEAIAALAKKGAALIVTVDCGIRSVEEVAYGNRLGLQFIITDHHHVPTDAAGNDVLPPAAAVINPKRADNEYPFRELAGVGVAFKLVQALRQAVSPKRAAVPTLQDDALLDLVAIGTVADMVPLLGENRSLVKRGLRQVNQPRRVGLHALIQESHLAPGDITAGSIGFILGPRLNAAGRLAHARLAYRLLSTGDSRQASQLAQKLGHINAERQDMTRQFVEQARSRILEDRQLAPLYLIADPRFNEGVVGLVASRLTDEFYRPTLVARRGTRITKGSGRSIPEFDITRALDQCADLLVRYGGHAAAAGFTIETDNLPRLQARLTEIAHRALDDQPLQKTMLVDAEINLRGVTPQLVTEVHNLAPFGYNNPTPKFLTRGLVVQYCRPVGRDGSHLKMKLSDGKRLWDAIGFRMAAQWGGLAQGARVDAVYNLEFNTWNGRTAMQLNLKDLRLSEAS